MKVLYSSWEEHQKNSNKSGSDPMVIPWLFSKPFRKQHPDKVKEIKAKLTGGYLSRDSGAFERQTKSNVNHDTRGRLNSITVPTLILVGKDDELTPIKMAEEMKSELPNAKLLVFEQGGHGLYWEVPDLFNKAVVDFLNGQQ